MKRDAVDLSKPVIQAYRVPVRGIEHDGFENTPQDRVEWAQAVREHGGFNPATGAWRPLERLDENDVWLHEVLDHITAACEAGVVEKFGWSTQLFAKPTDLEWFLDQLRYYDDTYRITDRWWLALAHLSGSESCEEGFISCEEIVNSLEEAIETGKSELNRLALQTKYLEENPSVPLDLSRRDERLLVEHNRELRGSQQTNWWDYGHFTNRIPFTHLYHYLEGGELRAREAIAEDIAALRRAARAVKAVQEASPKRRTKVGVKVNGKAKAK